MHFGHVHRRAGTALASASLLAALALPSTAAAVPTQVLNTHNGSNGQSVRAAGQSLGANIKVSNNPHTIIQIGVLVDLNANGNLKFIVVDHDTHQLVHVTAPKAFNDDGKTWKLSNTISVQLMAGKTYDIGAISDQGAAWAYDISSATMGDFKSVLLNPNFSGYANPVVASHGGVDGAVKLFEDVISCGDGKVEGQEECDDGNDSDNDACLSNCVKASCGDMFVWDGMEECDDGNDSDNDASVDACKSALRCDGYLPYAVFGFDDGNDDDTDGCVGACSVATCGDGFLHVGVEACDDGNAVDGDACTNACGLPGCGDGVVQAGEECDDGNADDSDACTSLCKLPICGDGIVQEGEACDDGDGSPKDSATCDSDCTPVMCGDDHINVEAGEMCEGWEVPWALCSKNLCKFICAAGHGNCDDDPLNGCETSLKTVNNCGGCGIVCPDTKICGTDPQTNKTACL
ncbi:MAG: DUF4215 domain-containing protein [Myxococcales bacterium]|nr:DUF4215 domain-containing protein [Myxococcales bacterium]